VPGSKPNNRDLPEKAMSGEPERSERVKALFGEAAELPEADWAAFLVHKCPDDDNVRLELLRLLGFGARSHAFVDNLPVLPGILTEAAEGPRSCNPGDSLAGRFRIVRLVGRGGMGEVYEAFDELLDQTVALKTIRPEIVGEPRMEERFRREVPLARQVTHPHVCRVFDYMRTDQLGQLQRRPRRIDLPTRIVSRPSPFPQHIRTTSRIRRSGVHSTTPCLIRLPLRNR
jgi:Protein kinase domain